MYDQVLCVPPAVSESNKMKVLRKTDIEILLAEDIGRDLLCQFFGLDA